MLMHNFQILQTKFFLINHIVRGPKVESALLAAAAAASQEEHGGSCGARALVSFVCYGFAVLPRVCVATQFTDHTFVWSYGNLPGYLTALPCLAFTAFLR